MKIKSTIAVFDSENIVKNPVLNIRTQGNPDFVISDSDTVAYMPLINSHDHLVGNWYPRAANNRPYLNSHIWVEDMKDAAPYKERDKFWVNKGFTDLSLDNGLKMSIMGAYKNLFNGCAVVQDHIPMQPKTYYDQMPIQVLGEFGQYHSITLGNWWGGLTAEEEMAKTNKTLPFIMHLGEGIDNKTKGEFDIAAQRGLIKSNTILIHCICLTHAEIDYMAEQGATICWCPFSNDFLIGQSVDIDYAIKSGINIVIGTDSSMSGSINLFEELQFIAKHYPQVPLSKVYEMITVNASKALCLNKEWRLKSDSSDILLTEQLTADPFENLTKLSPEHIKLLIHDGKPLYGDSKYFAELQLSPSEYTIVNTTKGDKFVIGDPKGLNNEIDSYLGYHKNFPYLPF